MKDLMEGKGKLKKRKLTVSKARKERGIQKIEEDRNKTIKPQF